MSCILGGKHGASMPASHEPYIAVLQGTKNGESVTYGNEVIVASTDDEAKVKAIKWANDLHLHVQEKATLILKKGSRGVFRHEFEAV
jgi:hypothetical protein